MTIAEMITEARSLINITDSSNSPVSDAQLTEWANQFYRRLQAKLGTIPKKERDNTLASGVITLNSRTLYINVARLLDANTSTYKRLTMITLEDLVDKDPDYENTPAAVPTHLVRTGTFTMIAYPTPDTANATTTIRTHGQEFPADLTSSETPDVPLHLHDIFPHWMAYRSNRQLGRREDATEQLIVANSRVKELKTTADKLQRNARWSYSANDNW